MIPATVGCVEHEQIGDDAPPPGTAIVRPLRYVRAVRERHLAQFANPAEVAASRSVRAWAWALGESDLAPVTDQQTVVPPSRAEIEAEIAEADERIFRNDEENRADGASKILRWLIGVDDRCPIRVANPGELVGGFGDIVRSRDQILDVIARAAARRSNAAAQMRDLTANSDERLCDEQEAAYLDGVIATLGWVLGNRDSPITRTPSRDLTSRDLKTERLHAEDVIEQPGGPWLIDRLQRPAYSQGVIWATAWADGGHAASTCPVLKRVSSRTPEGYG